MKNLTNRFKEGFSRRRFMKGALLGAGAVAAGSNWNIAEVLAGGKTASDIRGYGVEEGWVGIGSNDNPLGPSPRAVAAIAENLHKINRYDFGLELPIQLNQRHGIMGSDGFSFDFGDMRSFMKFREVNRVMATPGSGPILQTLAALAAKDGGECIEAVPGYGQIARSFEAFRMIGKDVKVIRVPTTENYIHNLEAMKDAITPRTKLVTITNPNNPTGTIVPHAELAAFVKSIPEHVIVLIDEAYIDFVRDPNYQDGVNLALENNNVVVARTFSKIYGLAGLRIGYAIASQRMMDQMMVQQGFFGGGLSSLGIHAALAALDDDEFVNRTKKITNDGKDYLIGKFDEMGLEYTPSHGNFMIVDVKRNSGRMAMELRKRGISIRSGSVYNTAENSFLKNHLRVSIGRADELEVFINELNNILGKS